MLITLVCLNQHLKAGISTFAIVSVYVYVCVCSFAVVIKIICLLHVNNKLIFSYPQQHEQQNILHSSSPDTTIYRPQLNVCVCACACVLYVCGVTPSCAAQVCTRNYTYTYIYIYISFRRWWTLSVQNHCPFYNFIAMGKYINTYLYIYIHAYVQMCVF